MALIAKALESTGGRDDTLSVYGLFFYTNTWFFFGNQSMT